MTSAKNIIMELETNLYQFGLNPKDWYIYLNKITTTAKAKKKISISNIKIVSREFDDLYFRAEATVEKKKSIISATWTGIQLVAI